MNPQGCNVRSYLNRHKIFVRRFHAMRSKSVLSPVAFVAFIFLFIAAGLCPGYKSEFSIQGRRTCQDSDNIDIPHEATKTAAFDWFTVIT